MNATASQLRSLASLSQWTREAPRRAPQRLTNWLRRCGGVQDQRGELTCMTGGKRYRGFGLVSCHGMPLDEAAYQAWEAGYIPTPERPTIAEFLDYLDRDLAGLHVYAADDWEILAAYESGEDARIELDKLGLLADTPAKQRQVERALVLAAERLEAANG